MQRHFEETGAAQISHRYSGQTALRGKPKITGVVRETGDITGYPRVACDPQMGAIHFPQL
jgi:hypothetical protein